MSLGQKIIITVGAFVITFITVCTFFKSDIDFLLTSRTVERNYGKIFVEKKLESSPNW